MHKVSLIIASAALCWQVAASANDKQSDVERQTRFGPVVGIDDSAASGTYAWKGVPFAKAPVGDAALEGAGRPDSWKQAARRHSSSATPACSTGASTARRQQPLRPDHRHHAEPGRRQRRLPVPEHLDSGRHGTADPRGHDDRHDRATMTTRRRRR